MFFTLTFKKKNYTIFFVSLFLKIKSYKLNECELFFNL